MYRYSVVAILCFLLQVSVASSGSVMKGRNYMPPKFITFPVRSNPQPRQQICRPTTVTRRATVTRDVTSVVPTMLTNDVTVTSTTISCLTENSYETSTVTNPITRTVMESFHKTLQETLLSTTRETITETDFSTLTQVQQVPHNITETLTQLLTRTEQVVTTRTYYHHFYNRSTVFVTQDITTTLGCSPTSTNDAATIGLYSTATPTAAPAPVHAV